MQKNEKESVIEVCASPFRGTGGGKGTVTLLVVTVPTDTTLQWFSLQKEKFNDGSD